MNQDEVVKALEGLKEFTNDGGKATIGGIVVAVRSWKLVEEVPEKVEAVPVVEPVAESEAKPAEPELPPEEASEDQRGEVRDAGEMDQEKAADLGLPVLK